VFHSKKEYAKAISDYNRAIELNLKNAVAFYERGLAFREWGNEGQAQRDFDKAKQLGYTGPK
jgi:tetratricopeptide (TPR) repeat protein